jgi:two-component system response regulator GlrR
MAVGERSMAAISVLVVEDASIARLMKDVLDDGAFMTTVCDSLDDALSAASALQPSVIVADLLMDGADGSAFYSRLRRAGVGCPVILCSAWHEAMNVAADLGVWFVPQPFEIEDLVAAVTEAAAESQGLAKL